MIVVLEDLMPFCADISVKKRRWMQRPAASDVTPPPGVALEAALVAAGRGVTDLAAFFRPTFAKAMPDPLSLRDMDRAIGLFADAVESKRTIGIIGDYDVDGATSTAILVRFLGMLGHDRVAWRIPHRIREGYGPNDGLVEAMAAEDGVELLMIVDSGTAAVGPIARARELGLDVVVLDHHEAGAELPDAVLVNPKRPDEDRSFDYLCTAGLAFLFAVGVARELRTRGAIGIMDLRGLLGLVALGTVADVVPLVGLNRAYVYLGLDRLGELPGIAALAEVTREAHFTAHACGFVFGPCVNAAGRLDDMRLGAELLMTDDPARAAELAGQLNELNLERRNIQKAAVEEAKELASARSAGEGVLVLADPNWHPGIVGLVASKVKDAFDRPAVVVGEGGKGSCRSVDGFDMGAAIIEARESGILEKGGGHAMAAGLTVAPDRIEELREFLCRKAEGFEHPPAPLDLVLPCGGLTVAMAEGFERLAPFGQGNTKPRVAVVGGYVRKVMVMKGLHVKAWLSGADGETEVIAFNSVDTPIGEALKGAEGRYADVYGVVECSTWNGVVKAVLKPEDVMLGRDMDAAAA